MNVRMVLQGHGQHVQSVIGGLGGRPITRENLRRHFEVNRYYVAVAALKTLADEGSIPVSKVTQAIKKYGIDTNKPNPITA